MPNHRHCAIICLLATAPLAVAASGCGRAMRAGGGQGGQSLSVAPDQWPIPAGRGSRYRLPALWPAVARRAPIARLRCSSARRRSFGIHLELYAHRLVLPVPAGIGIAPPQHRRGVYILAGACLYPLRTFEPTGVAVLDAEAPYTLAQLFAVWGQPLSRGTLASFRGPVLAFLDGHRWRGSPGAIPLRRHAEIVLEIDGRVPPHPRYQFPPGV
jgi:hypothetical protein